MTDYTTYHDPYNDHEESLNDEEQSGPIDIVKAFEALKAQPTKHFPAPKHASPERMTFDEKVFALHSFVISSERTLDDGETPEVHRDLLMLWLQGKQEQIRQRKKV